MLEEMSVLAKPQTMAGLEALIWY